MGINRPSTAPAQSTVAARRIGRIADAVAAVLLLNAAACGQLLDLDEFKEETNTSSAGGQGGKAEGGAGGQGGKAEGGAAGQGGNAEGGAAGQGGNAEGGAGGQGGNAEGGAGGQGGAGGTGGVEPKCQVIIEGFSNDSHYQAAPLITLSPAQLDKTQGTPFAGPFTGSHTMTLEKGEAGFVGVVSAPSQITFFTGRDIKSINVGCAVNGMPNSIEQLEATAGTTATNGISSNQWSCNGKVYGGEIIEKKVGQCTASIVPSFVCPAGQFPYWRAESEDATCYDAPPQF